MIVFVSMEISMNISPLHSGRLINIDRFHFHAEDLLNPFPYKGELE